MNHRKTPFEQIKRNIQQEGYLPKEMFESLPKGWRRVGTVGMLELNHNLWPWRKQIGTSYLSVLNEFSTIIHKVGVTKTPIRTPAYEILAGKAETITEHIELNCRFWIDPLKLTFSTGNHAERKRLIAIVKEGEQILDMFACVGNISIPISVHHPTTQIKGVEINPYAYSFLEKNVQVNHVGNRYEPILGDNQTHSPENWADRVLMGFFELTPQQLKRAIQSLKQDRGGIIHTHGLTTENSPNDWRKTIELLLTTEFPQFKVINNTKRIIKTVAPGIQHFVDDIEIHSTK
ncbi:MAG: class I SAM-dependent methyltransferase [Candidatus Hodarchaeales archaeon]